MAWIALTQKAGASFGNAGKFFHFQPITTGSQPASWFTEHDYPTGVHPTNTRASMAIYNGDGVTRAYFCGHATMNMVFTEDWAWLEQGILPFTNELVNASGAGENIGVTASGTGITGEAIVYLSKWDDTHGRRSPLSGASPTITLSNQGLLIDNLPTSDPDPSVTHIEVWHSVDGSDPALALRIQLGAASITDTVTTLSLGEVFGVDFGRFPRCKFNAIYHGRQVMAGDDRHPDRLYLSELTFPEQYGGLFLRTRQGEPIVAIAEVRDILLVFGPRSTYIVQGYTEDDLEMQVLEPQIGALSHAGIISVHGLLIIPSHLGFYLSTGSSFHFISTEFEDTWRKEYAANESSYQYESWAANDPERNVYKFWIETLPDEVSRVLAADLGEGVGYWALDYNPLLTEVGGSFAQPNLSFDRRARRDECAAILTNPGSSRGHLYTGSCDGSIRQENDSTDADDDGDTFEKTFHVRTGHYLWEPGGGADDGWKHTEFWLFHECEQKASTLDLFFGDEDAWRHIAGGDPVGDYTETIPAGLKTDEETGLLTFSARNVHDCQPNHPGRGMSVSWTVKSPTAEVAWRGFGGMRIPGTNYRGPISGKFL